MKKSRKNHSCTIVHCTIVRVICITCICLFLLPPFSSSLSLSLSFLFTNFFFFLRLWPTLFSVATDFLCSPFVHSCAVCLIVVRVNTSNAPLSATTQYHLVFWMHSGTPFAFTSQSQDEMNAQVSVWCRNNQMQTDRFNEMPLRHQINEWGKEEEKKKRKHEQCADENCVVRVNKEPLFNGKIPGRMLITRFIGYHWGWVICMDKLHNALNPHSSSNMNKMRPFPLRMQCNSFRTIHDIRNRSSVTQYDEIKKKSHHNPTPRFSLLLLWRSC